MNEYKYTDQELANTNFFGNYVGISTQLKELESYLTEFQKYIEVTSRHLQSSQIKGYDTDTLENLKYHFKYSHGDLLIRSTIISLAILLETQVREFCDEYQKHLKIKLKLRDLNGGLLQKFKMYSTKVIDLKFDFQSSLWGYITGFYEIRNCLVHNSGLVENFGNKKIIEFFVSRNEQFEIDEGGDIILSYKSCLEAIKKVEHFFVTITELAFDKFPGSCRLKDAEKYELAIRNDK